MKRFFFLSLALIASAVLVAQVDSTAYNNAKDFVDTIGNLPTDSKFGFYSAVFSVALGILTSETVKMLPLYAKFSKFVVYVAYAIAVVSVFVVFGFDMNFAWVSLVTILSGQGYYEVKKATKKKGS
ncbi:MAG: hypothetical protein D6698_10385 [Gammaproteobacteria bacterium]|nr:MAG: hypothetical protein D6698_10385 [Gammaproteobacteria bacterium]